MQQSLRIIIDAGKIVHALFQRREQLEISYKSDETLLTQADIASHNAICANLRKLCPQLPIISEESPLPSPRESLLWMLDPLDGTKHFVSGNGDYSINLALIVNDQPVFAIVHGPEQGLTYIAIQGHGSYRVDNAGIYHRLYCNTAAITQPRILISHGILGHRLLNFVQHFPDYSFQRLGGGLKMCFIADNRGDIYPRFGKTCEWDTAAPQLILTESGGNIHTHANTPLTYNKIEMTNPEFIAYSPSIILPQPWYMHEGNTATPAT